jgi:hypothetical protein
LFYGNTVNGANSPSYTPVQVGIYTVVVTDANGCETRADYDYSMNSVDELDGVSFNIYPNPLTDFLLIEIIGSESSEIYELKLLDYRGRVVKSLSFQTQVKINRDNLAAGIYMLQISNNDEFIKRKVMIADKY